jgi:hypothetical protein
MLVGFARYSQDQSFSVLCRNKVFVLVMAVGSVAGSFIGGHMLGLAPKRGATTRARSHSPHLVVEGLAPEVGVGWAGVDQPGGLRGMGAAKTRSMASITPRATRHRASPCQPAAGDHTLFGLFAVSAMLMCFVLENHSHWFVLLFAVLCALGSTYGFLQGA